MSWVRNLLISFGAFWLSGWTILLFAWPIAKVTNGIIYGPGVLSAIAMGVMTSMDSAVAAALAAVLVMFAVPSRRPECWAVIVAMLYVVDSRQFGRWHLPPTARDRLWQATTILFPAVVCVTVAFVIAHLRRKSDHAAGNPLAGHLANLPED